MNFWTNRQWDALLRMTDIPVRYFVVSMSIGDVYLKRRSAHYLLEYPTHSVTLKRGVPPNSKDLDTLRYMYNEYLSSMSI